MNFRKSWLLSFLFVGLFSFASIAATPIKEKPTSVNEQISKLLQGIEKDVVNTVTLNVDFMLNDKSEIIVISTNDKNLDFNIKSKLNYKTLKAPSLENFKKYTVPVTIKK